MYGTIEVSGMVIGSMNIGEFDKRITILTREKGKISAFVRGARRPNSQLLGPSRLLSCGKFVLYEGREAYNLQSANIKKYFEEISSDIESTCYASYFSELANYYAKEYLSEPQLLNLMYYALLAITNEKIPNKLVRRVFELRAMVIGGEYEAYLQNASPGCKHTWDFIINTPLRDLFRFNLREDIFEELEENVQRNLDTFIDKKMKSLEILKEICA